MKKLVTLLLCVAMVLTFMAPAMAETIPELPLVAEPVTYTIMANLQGNDVDPKEVPLQMWLEENTNVHFEWTILTNAETSERISTVMASGDLPDVFINCLGDSHRLTYGQAGALLPVNEYLEHMPNFTVMLEEESQLKPQLTLPDGNMYSIPQVNMYSTWPGDGKYVRSHVSINQKWLDALGLEAPTTTDELKTVLDAFVNGDPNGNGEKDEMGLTFMYNGWNSNINAFLFGPFGFVGNGNAKTVEDGVVSYALLHKDYVQAVSYIADLFTSGLIDPEVFTHDQNRYDAKIKEGNVGIYIDWEGTTFANDPEDPTYVQMAALKGPEGESVWHNQAAGINANYCMIASTAENPEILCKYFDYMMTDEISFQTLWGTFGHYSENNGDGTYTRFTGADYPQIFESAIRVMPANMDNDLVSRCFEKNVDTGVVTDKTGNSKYISSLMYADLCVEEYYPSILLGDEANERLAVLSTPVSNAITEKEIAWMMGESDITAEYETFCAEVNALGLTEMIEIYQAAYDNAMGK